MEYQPPIGLEVRIFAVGHPFTPIPPDVDVNGDTDTMVVEVSDSLSFVVFTPVAAVDDIAAVQRGPFKISFSAPENIPIVSIGLGSPSTMILEAIVSPHRMGLEHRELFVDAQAYNFAIVLVQGGIVTALRAGGLPWAALDWFRLQVDLCWEHYKDLTIAEFQDLAERVRNALPLGALLDSAEHFYVSSGHPNGPPHQGPA